MNILFVVSGNSSFGITPFIKSQGDSLIKQNVNIQYFKITGKGTFGYLKNIYRLRHFIKKNNFDIVHAHYALCGWVALLAFCKIPLVVSYMGCDVYGDISQDGKRTGWINIFLSQLLQPFVNAIIVKSKNLEDYIIFKKKSYLVPNGVNFKLFYPVAPLQCKKELSLSNDKKIVLFLGDPKDPRKNITLLKKGLNIMNCNNVQLVNPYPADPIKIPIYLNSADVFVLTSLNEGSPNVIKEAMACNCPIVATDVGDVAEVIGSTVGCYICKNDPKDVAAKINLALKFGKRTSGREQIRHLEESVVAVKLINIYKTTIQNA